MLRDAYEPDTIPLVGELDELETFVGKKNKLWLWTAVNHFQPGILGWVLGDRASYNFSTTMGGARAIGNVAFISQMDNQFTPCLSQMETKLSVKLT